MVPADPAANSLHGADLAQIFNCTEGSRDGCVEAHVKHVEVQSGNSSGMFWRTSRQIKRHWLWNSSHACLCLQLLKEHQTSLLRAMRTEALTAGHRSQLFWLLLPQKASDSSVRLADGDTPWLCAATRISVLNLGCLEMNTAESSSSVTSIEIP